jgi:signal transduction histidine kinase
MFRTLKPWQLAMDITVPILFGLLYAPTAYYRDPLYLLFLLGMVVAAIFWRLSPGLALGIAWVTALAQVATVGYPDAPNVAILLVLFGTGASINRAVRWLGFASSFAGAFVVTGVLVAPGVLRQLITGNFQISNPLDTDVINALVAVVFVFFGSLAAFLLSWTGGRLTLAITRARDSRRAAVVAEQEVAAEQERTRIARDMHDVVAHSLAVVVAQADGARYIASKDPKATEEALVTISTTAREALSDVRVLLAQLRHSQSDGPQPTLVDLERLFAQLRAAGLTISDEVTGTPLTLGTAQQLAVYRIVQESLTNALRHADRKEPVTVHFGWTPHGLDLTVASTLRAPAVRTGAIRTGLTPALGTTGHGIAGMTERALLVGGHLSAGPEAGRFVVRAWLPANPVTQEPATAGVTA